MSKEFKYIVQGNVSIDDKDYDVKTYTLLAKMLTVSNNLFNDVNKILFPGIFYTREDSFWKYMQFYTSAV